MPDKNTNEASVKEQMLEYLRANPRRIARLLSYDASDVRINDVFDAEFLASVEAEKHTDAFRTVARDLRDEVRNLAIAEVPLREGQIVVDYRLGDNGVDSAIDVFEEEGGRYIHTEPYHPSRFVRDVSRNGTTGHASRRSAADVSFHTFECPFGVNSVGTGFRYKVPVGTAAEASYLYEAALRGDVDFVALLGDLRRRGLVKGGTRTETDNLARDLSAQFAWMREQICRDPSLADIPIVADSLMVADGSMGRSVYDADYAPCAAHVLARYINNPLLLYSSSENGVLRALSATDKNEQYRFSSVAGKGRIVVVVDGSDTIGGREPGTRAISGYSRGGKTYRYQFKSRESVESDYHSFAARLESTMANIAPGVEVLFVSDTGIGLPQMLSRFVKEHGGDETTWRFNGRLDAGFGRGKRFSLVNMPHFDRVAPALMGPEAEVTFQLDDADGDSAVTFRKDDLAASGVLSFSVAADRRNADILARGSMAISQGLAVIHVQENRGEADQAASLAYESSVISGTLSGLRNFEDSLFGGQLRRQWDMEDSALMSLRLDDAGGGTTYVPYVSLLNDSAVHFNSVPYHSVLSLYAAYMLSEAGFSDSAEYLRLAGYENSVAYINLLLSSERLRGVGDEARERCMRNAVEHMARVSASFCAELLATQDRDIVVASDVGDGSLFVNAKGEGENRFGIALQWMRGILAAEVNLERRRAEEESRRTADDNARLQRRADGRKASLELMGGGLPGSVEASANAVWLLGTSRPGALFLDEGRRSFDVWRYNPGRGGEPLNRETAARATIQGGGGKRLENRYVYLFPSDLQAVMGRRKVRNNPDSVDLTDVRRVNPATGQEFVCAFGIPVKNDGLFFDPNNPYERTSSFRSDRDVSTLLNDIVAADTRARVTAMQQDMSLCLAARVKNPYSGVKMNDDISRVFRDKIWDFPRNRNNVIDRVTGRIIQEAGTRIPDVVKERVYDRSSRKSYVVEKTNYVRSWVDNPHAAPRLAALTARYIDMLTEGMHMPLNCICLRRNDYVGVDVNVFVADFNLALKAANSLAVAMGQPLRVPLDESGRLYLGPDVPEEHRMAAENALYAFFNIGQREQAELANDMTLERISISRSHVKDRPLSSLAGVDIHLRPFDLVSAFGPYDFRSAGLGTVSGGGRAVPLLEMAFRDADGTLYRITDTRLNLSVKDTNEYLANRKNDKDSIRFRVSSSDPDRIPAFVAAVKAYIARAQSLKVETRLVSVGSDEGRDMPMDGYVSIPSSNGVDNELKPGVTVMELPNRFDGTDTVEEYPGRIDARDGFEGWVQYRYLLEDGTASEWLNVPRPDAMRWPWNTDETNNVRDDVMYGTLMRDYRTDRYALPAGSFITAELQALAMEHGGGFRDMNVAPRLTKERPVVESVRVLPSVTTMNGAGEGSGRLFVTSYDSSGIPDNAVKVQLTALAPYRMKDDIDIVFKSVWADEATMLAPLRKGEIDDAEFARRYVSGLLEPNADKIVSGLSSVLKEAAGEGRDVFMLSWEKPGEPGVRTHLASFLKERGIDCAENPVDIFKYGARVVTQKVDRPAVKENAAMVQRP